MQMIYFIWQLLFCCVKVNDCRTKNLMKGGPYQKTSGTNFIELRITDSTLNEGTNSLVNK